MSNLWERRAEQAQREAEGVPVTLPEYPGALFRVRRMCEWNEHHARAVARVTATPAARAYLERVKVPGYVATPEDSAFDATLQREAFAEGCIAGWQGFPGPDGNPYPFTIGNAATLLATFPDIYTALRAVAATAAHFVPRDPEQLAGLAAKN